MRGILIPVIINKCKIKKFRTKYLQKKSRERERELKFENNHMQ